MEPNPSFTHTVPGLWLETEKRVEEEKGKTKVGKETRRWGFSLQGTSRAFVKNFTLCSPFCSCSTLTSLLANACRGRSNDMRFTQ